MAHPFCLPGACAQCPADSGLDEPNLASSEENKMTVSDASSTNIEERGYAKPDVLVSTDWVAQHLNDPKVRIIESDEDPLLYKSGHVPDAVEVDWVRDLNDPLRRDYLNREGFEALASRIG